MDAKEVLKELSQMGNESIKNVLVKHGAREPFYGVKVADMKKIQKKIKKDYELSLALYDTGNSDAMYFAGLIADETKMTKKDLTKWVNGAYWYYLSEYAVAWVTAESKFGYELAMQWIDSDEENVASCGWGTLNSFIAITPDEELPLADIEKLLQRVEKTIHESKNRVRYTMNGFVIAVGTYIESLMDKAVACAKKIGKVDVEMGGTACKVPLAHEYIFKVLARKAVGKKRKSARC